MHDISFGAASVAACPCRKPAGSTGRWSPAAGGMAGQSILFFGQTVMAEVPVGAERHKR